MYPWQNPLEPEFSFGPVNRDGEALKLSMQHLHLSGKLLPVGALLWVRHDFESAESNPVEVVYTYVLPRNGALRRFLVKGNNFTVKSQLLPKEDAETKYEEALLAGDGAALAKRHIDGYSSLTLGNLEPGEKLSVGLEIVAGVNFKGSKIRFRFPFTVAPCYHPEMRVGLTPEGFGELELPESVAGDLLLPPIKPDAKGLHAVTFSLKVEMPEEIASISSPSHPISVAADGTKAAWVTLAKQKDVPNRDLVLDVEMKENPQGIMWGSTQDGAKHFVAFIPASKLISACEETKKEEGEAEEGPSRRLVFLVDISDSMAGEPLDAAKRAVLACLDALPESCQVGLVAFESWPHAESESLSPCTEETKERMRSFVEKLTSMGGTEIVSGIEEAQKLLGDEGGELFIVTDLQVFDAQEIIEAFGSQVHAHWLGIGTSSQDWMLAELSDALGGEAAFIRPDEDVEAKALELLEQSVVSSVSVSIDNGEISPRPPSVLQRHSHLMVWGELPPESEKANLSINYQEQAGERRSMILELTPPAKASAAVALFRGSRLIQEAERANKGMLPELGKRFGLANSQLSLVAVWEKETLTGEERPQTVMVPVGMPEGVKFEAYFPGRELYSAPAPRTGLYLAQSESFSARRYSKLPYIDRPHEAYARFDFSDDILEDIARSLLSSGKIDEITHTFERSFLATTEAFLIAASLAHTRKDKRAEEIMRKTARWLSRNSSKYFQEQEKEKWFRKAISLIERGEADIQKLLSMVLSLLSSTPRQSKREEHLMRCIEEVTIVNA